VVDDHALFRLGIKGALSTEQDIELIAEAESGDELLQMLENGTVPDLVFLDIIMPGISGLATARILKKKYPAIKILLLSAETTRENINEAIEIGVDGFIGKADAPKEISQAIRSLQNEEPYFGAIISRIMYEVLIAERLIGHSKREEKGQVFSERELEIIEACSRGLTSKEMAEALFISKRTVDWHRSNIFSKLGIKNNIELVKYAIRHGIIEL
jgi:DNA-binding NarL/FixJ family response regulator